MLTMEVPGLVCNVPLPKEDRQRPQDMHKVHIRNYISISHQSSIVSARDVSERGRWRNMSSEMKERESLFLPHSARTHRVCFQFAPQKRRPRTYSNGERLHTDVTKSEIDECSSHVAQMNLMNFWETNCRSAKLLRIHLGSRCERGSLLIICGDELVCGGVRGTSGVRSLRRTITS